MKCFSLIFILLFNFSNSFAQDSLFVSRKVYHVNQSLEASVSGALIGLSMLGLLTITDKPTLTEKEVNALNRKDIPFFDRSSVRQSYPAPENIYDLTDIGLYGSSALVSLLLLDDDIREDWLDIGLLFLETQAINLNIYFWGGPAFSKRIRPIVYYKDVSMEIKTGKDMTDSFFSGHISMTAAATFFMAKVYSDYHPQLGADKWWLYGAAVIPPALVGYGRYRGLMHFPSDILLGFSIGSTLGIVVPQLHKITKENGVRLSIVPFVGEYSGLNAAIHF